MPNSEEITSTSDSNQIIFWEKLSSKDQKPHMNIKIDLKEKNTLYTRI